MSTFDVIAVLACAAIAGAVARRTADEDGSTAAPAVAAAGVLLLGSTVVPWAHFGDVAWSLGDVVAPTVDDRPRFVGTNGLWLHAVIGAALLAVGLTGADDADWLGVLLAGGLALMALPDLWSLGTLDSIDAVVVGRRAGDTYYVTDRLTDVNVSAGAGVLTTVLAGVVAVAGVSHSRTDATTDVGSPLPRPGEVDED